MDSSNLQARSSGGNEEQLRKATNRYMDNLKAEFGISEKQALKEATDVYSGSGNTIPTSARTPKRRYNVNNPRLKSQACIRESTL